MMTNDWKSQLAGVNRQIDVSVIRATRDGVAGLRHTPMSALSHIRQNEPELLVDGQPLAPAVRQWLPKIRTILQRDTDNRVLIVGCQMRNIDPKDTGFIDGKRVILFENDESKSRITKSLPDAVGVLFQAKFQSHGRMLPLINEAKTRTDPVTMKPRPVLIVPVLRPTEIRQLITLGSMSENELLAKLQPRLPANVQAAMKLAAPETRAATEAILDGALRKFVQPVAEPIAEIETAEDDESPVLPNGALRRGALQNFVDRHPALDGEGVSAQARRLTPAALQYFRRPEAHREKTFKSLETTISANRKRLAQTGPAAGTPSVPPTSAPPPDEPPPPVLPLDEPPPPPPPPRPVNSAPPAGALDKSLSAIDALGDSLGEIELHAAKMAHHGKQLVEHIGMAKFAIENLRGDLKSGLHADIEQRVRAALAHVMGPLA
jgi:hypothetical protein